MPDDQESDEARRKRLAYENQRPVSSIGQPAPDTRPDVSEFKKRMVRAIWGMELKDK